MSAPAHDLQPRSRLLLSLRAQANVYHALLLRDIRTRMFGSAWGFVLAILWPFSHILLIVLIYSHLGRIAPYGDSMPLWVATGIVPFVCFSYMSRFAMLGVVLNKPLLYFPLITIMDILLSRCLLEMLSASSVILLVVILFSFAGIDMYPHNLGAALTAVLAAMLLGLGSGVLNGVIAAISPPWVTAYSLFIIVMWITSGILFVPSTLPEEVRYYIWFNPAIHVIEWMRDAYFDSYNSVMLTKPYPILLGAGMLFVGMALERMLRGKILS